MTKTNTALEPRSTPPDENPGYNDLFGNGHPLAIRAPQGGRFDFDNQHYNGMDGPAYGPEIYPVYQADGQSAKPCEVCDKSNANCACWSW